MKDRCTELEETMHREVPISREMGVKVAAFDGKELSLTADFKRNINPHGSVFGGSLFSLCALCGWGFLRLKFIDIGTPVQIVLSEGKISYKRPVRSNVAVSCKVQDDEAYTDFLRKIERRGMAKLTVEMTISDGGKTAVRFTGRFATTREK